MTRLWWFKGEIYIYIWPCKNVRTLPPTWTHAHAHRLPDLFTHRKRELESGGITGAEFRVRSGGCVSVELTVMRELLPYTTLSKFTHGARWVQQPHPATQFSADIAAHLNDKTRSGIVPHVGRDPICHLGTFTCSPYSPPRLSAPPAWPARPFAWN